MNGDIEPDVLEDVALKANGGWPDLTLNLPIFKEKQPSSTLVHKEEDYKSNRSSRDIEYQPLLADVSFSSDNEQKDDYEIDSLVANTPHLSCNHFESDPQFDAIVKKVEVAIDNNILPKRIDEGSSGSYFCKSIDNVL